MNSRSASTTLRIVRVAPFVAISLIVVARSRAQTSPFPLPFPTRPTEEGHVVGWGGSVVGTNDCNLAFKAVATGRFHSLALKNDGSIIAWGESANGVLNVPLPNSDWIAIAACDLQNLGLKSDGSIVAWGLSTVTPIPNTDFIDIAAGLYHNLGLKRDGSIVVWGFDPSAQLNVPEPNSNFVKVAAGYAHSMGLKADGSIVVWGCGVPNNYGECDIPVPNSGFIAIAAGSHHSLGLRSDGSIVGWGFDLAFPNTVPEPNSGFVSIAAGGLQSVGIKADGTIQTWGQSSIQPPSGSFIAADAGEWNSLAIRPDGSIVEWGSLDVPYPNDGYVAIAGGSRNGMALRLDGTISVIGSLARAPQNSDFVSVGTYSIPNSYQWGFKADGSLIEWGQSYRVSPPSSNIVAIARGTGHAVKLRSDGSIGIDCYTNMGQCALPTPNSGFVAVAAGNLFNVGLKSNGSIVSWGSSTFVPPPNENFAAIAAGPAHWLGLKNDGSVVGWPSTNPAARVPEPNTAFVAVSAGYDHSVGLKSDGSVVAWGNNSVHQLDVPQPNSDFIAVSAGFQSSLALRRVADCNHNGRPDSCDIDVAGLPDVDADRIPDECQTSYTLDIRPGACPNVLNVRGRYPVQIAIVATRRASVSQIDLDSLMLKRADGFGDPIPPDLGFHHSHVVIDDLSTPSDEPLCACNRLGPDGYDDLLLEFSSRDVMRKLDLESSLSGTSVELTLSGTLLDGSPFAVSDCILTAGTPRRTPQRLGK